jgi:hypothetical protein
MTKPPDFEHPQLPRLPEEGGENNYETLILGWLLGVESQTQLTMETFDRASGGVFYRLRPLTPDTASLHSHLQAGWSVGDLTKGKPVIEQLLKEAGYQEKRPPTIHNLVMFAPRTHGNQPDSAPERFVSSAVNFLRTKNLMVAQGKIFLINPPTMYTLSLKTISALYPPLREKVYVVHCHESDTGAVAEHLDQRMAAPDLDAWLQENVPYQTLRYPKMQR